MAVHTSINPDKLINRVIIWRAKKAFPDYSIPQLAEHLRIPKHVVRHAVKLLEAPPKEILQAFEHDSVAAWVQAVPIASAKGDHRPAKDLLLHTRAIDPVQLQGQTQIAIIFSGSLLPGINASPGEGDTIDLLPNVSTANDGNVRAVCAQSEQPIGDRPEPTPERGPEGSPG